MELRTLFRWSPRIALLVQLVVSTSGCVESSFELASESRLPKWFAVPENMTRDELSVTMDLYITSTGNGTKSVFTLYRKGGVLPLKQVTGYRRYPPAYDPAKQPPGVSTRYPVYAIVTVDGTTEIIEHRRMEPVFYVVDDDKIWREFGLKQNSKRGRKD